MSDNIFFDLQDMTNAGLTNVGPEEYFKGDSRDTTLLFPRWFFA